MDINDLRGEIDSIDSELVSLFEKRMETARKIAEYKMANNLPIYDSERERRLLNKISEKSGENFKAYTRVLFTMLMDLSKSYQHELMNKENTGLADEILKASETTQKLFPEKAVVACQGVEGAYSQLACEKVFAHPDIMYFNSFESVFQAVDKGLCRYGILPIENSTAGSVNRIYDLMSRYNFYIVRGARVQITHYLLANRGTKPEDIKEIFSHEQAINQCGNFLKDLKDVKVTVFENTAAAAKMVAQSGRTDIAAISSKACAQQYSLEIISKKIQDSDHNYTRFICISKNLEVYPGANRTSVMMTVPNKPGSLYRVIARFYALDINIVKLESRPIPGQDYEFQFYFDIDASVYSPKLAKLICECESQIEGFRYLGSYNEII